MDMRRITELEEKLKNNMDLTDEEYKEILSCRRYHLISSLLMLDDSYEFVVKDCANLSILATIIGVDPAFLLKVYGYYFYTLKQSKKNYKEMIETSEKITGNVSRLNVLNFVRQFDEIINYEELTGKLDETITNTIFENNGNPPYEKLKENFYALENSMNKIKILNKNYLK